MNPKPILYTDVDSLSFEIPDVVEKKTDHFYVNNKELQEEFVKYHTKKLECLEAGLPIPPLTNKIGLAIMQIATRRTYSRNFVGYTQDWKEEMIGDAIEVCVRYAHNYNPVKYNNPFAYITQLVSNEIINRIKKEKKAMYIKYKMFDNAGGFQAFTDDNVNSEDLQHLNETSDVYNDHLSYIADYETRNMTKPKKDEELGILEFLEIDEE